MKCGADKEEQNVIDHLNAQCSVFFFKKNNFVKIKNLFLESTLSCLIDKEQLKQIHQIFLLNFDVFVKYLFEEHIIIVN